MGGGGGGGGFHSHFLVSVSLLINIGKEMALPGFRITNVLSFILTASVNMERHY